MLKKCVFVFTVVISLPLFAYEKPVDESKTIFWQTYHRPPGVFLTGPNQGKGFVQQMLQLIISKLPEYDHKMPLSTLARAIEDIKQEKHSCHPSLFKTVEREKYMYFSNASVVTPTNRVITKKGRFDNYFRDGWIDLREIGKDQNLTFTFVKGRSFTDKVDKIIEQHVREESIFFMTNTDLSPSFQMIELGRVDATIAYPFELNYYAKNDSLSLAQFDIYPILGTPLFSTGYVACPKNEWGKLVIEKINIILAKLKPTKTYQDALTSGWEYERDNPLFIDYYQNKFLIQ